MLFASSANPQSLVDCNHNNHFAAPVSLVRPAQVVSGASQSGHSQLSNHVYARSSGGQAAANWTNFD